MRECENSPSSQALPSNDSTPIVGIDLGTTNSVVAGMVDGKVTVLAEEGNPIIPSVVGLDQADKMIVGVTAKNQLAAFPDRTVASVKRKMGSQEKVSLGDQSFTPQEISAMILRRLRDRASRVLGQPIERAVITVPAFFDENQRQATREAGLLAGLKVERIINEPTAATLVYHAGTDQRKQVLVYDFGGGTFDVSVVRFEGGVVEVLSSQGDAALGGDDLDEILLNHIADKFFDEHQVDLRTDATTRNRLLQACESAKCTLSQFPNAEIAEEFIAEVDGKPLNLKAVVTRQEFEELIDPFISKTVQCVDAALRDAGVTVEKIDDLILVGGSTRIPLVSERLTEEFSLLPSRAVDPDLAVALGAGTQAAMQSGVSVGPVLVDIASHTLGIVALSTFGPLDLPRRLCTPLIRRSSPLPATYEEVFRRNHPDQDRALIEVVQGESIDPDENTSIGEFLLPLKKGRNLSDTINVRFDLTLDGVLKVTATQKATGDSRELVIDNALSEFREDKRERAVARLGEMFDSSDQILDDADLPRNWTLPSSDDHPSGLDGEALSKFPVAGKLLAQISAVPDDQMSAEDAAEVKDLAEKLKQAVADQNQEKADEICEELDDVLFYITG